MNQINRILVATDTRLEDQTIVDAAAATAKHHQSTLMITDVVQDLSWLARLAAKDAAGIRDALLTGAGDRLATLADRFREQGIDVDTKVLEGKTSVCIVREVLRRDYDLVIAVSKGERSKSRGTFGQTAKQLLRNCPCPLWLVPPGSSPQFKHVLACVDTSSDDAMDAELNDKIYTLASAMSEQQHAHLSVLHAWKMDDEALLGARLKPETVAEYAIADEDYRKRLLDKFLKQYPSSLPDDDVHLVKADAPRAVSAFVDEGDVDLVVMGTVARSGLSGLIIGNTAEKILEEIGCSVLAVKPSSFKCPITSPWRR